MFLRKNKLPNSVELYELVHVLKSVDELLGNLPPDLIKGFSASRDYKLYEKIMHELVIANEPVPKPVIVEEPKKVEHPTFMQEQLAKANTPTNTITNNNSSSTKTEETPIKEEKAEFDLSKIEELLNKKLKNFEESQSKKEKELIDNLHNSLKTEIEQHFTNLPATTTSPQEKVKVEPKVEPKAEEPTLVPKAKIESEEKVEKKTGLLDLDKLRAKIDQKVKLDSSNKKTTPKKIETINAEPKKLEEVKVEPKVEPKAEKVKEETKTEPVTSNKEIPDMAAIKATIMNKLRGGQ